MGSPGNPGGSLKLPLPGGFSSLGSLDNSIKPLSLGIPLKLFFLNLNNPVIPLKPLLLGLGSFIKLLTPFLLGPDSPNKLLKLPFFQGLAILLKPLLRLL